MPTTIQRTMLVVWLALALSADDSMRSQMTFAMHKVSFWSSVALRRRSKRTLPPLAIVSRSGR